MDWHCVFQVSGMQGDTPMSTIEDYNVDKKVSVEQTSLLLLFTEGSMIH